MVGDESSKRALVKFDLGRASLASKADTSVAHGAVSSFTVCGDATVAGPGQQGPESPGPIARGSSCTHGLLRAGPAQAPAPFPPAPPAQCTAGGASLAGRAPWGRSVVALATAPGLPFQWRRQEESRAAGQDTFKQFPFLTTD